MRRYPACQIKSSVSPRLNQEKLVALEARWQWLFALKCDVVKSCSEQVPTGTRRGIGANHVRFRQHFHGATPKRPIDQTNFQFHRRARLNHLRAKKKDSAGTDIRRAQCFRVIFALTGDALHAQG
jgi:hypothetical protein